MSLNVSDCVHHYCNQAGGGGGQHYFRGIPIQRGYGLFGDIFRKISPFMIEAGKYLGKKLLHTGSKIIGDVSAGKPIRQSTKNRLLETGRTIGGDVMKNMQTGSGIKRKRNLTENHFSRKKAKISEGVGFSLRNKTNILKTLPRIKDSSRKKQKISVKRCIHKDIFT